MALTPLENMSMRDKKTKRQKREHKCLVTMQKRRLSVPWNVETWKAKDITPSLNPCDTRIKYHLSLCDGSAPPWPSVTIFIQINP